MPKIGEKHDRNQSLSSEDEESDHEIESQDEYEQDGFIVPDDQVSDEEPSSPDYPNAPEPTKKLKKSRMRLKKFDNEDKELIESNLGMSAPIHARTADELEKHLFPDNNRGEEGGQGPFRRQKVSDGESEASELSSEMSNEKQDRPRRSFGFDQMHVAASIFGVDPDITQQITEPKTDVFEPAECKERFTNKEDEVVRDSDIPERLQNRLKRRENPDENEIAAETEWLLQKYLIIKPQTPENGLRMKISLFLQLYRVEKYEIPFIAKYRMHRLHPEIATKADLWNLHEWDCEWGFIHTNKLYMKEILEEASYNATRLEEGDVIDRGNKILHAIAQPGEIPEQVKVLLQNTSPEFYRVEIEDIRRFIDVFVYELDEPMSKTKQMIMDARKNRLTEFLQIASISAIQYSQNLYSKSIIHLPPHSSHLSPQDVAFDLLCDNYPEELKVMDGAAFLLAKEMASLPLIRRCIAEEYLKVTKVVTFPTQKGNTALDIFNPLYHVKRLEKGKYYQEITPQL